MTGGTDEPDPSTGDSEQPTPLADLADRVGNRRDQPHQPDLADVFAEPPFHEMGSASVWDAIDGNGRAAEDSAAVPPDPDSASTVVSKREFCEQCQFFENPPAASCSHDEAQISEFVDREHVRVLDCPIVGQRHAGEATGVDDSWSPASTSGRKR